MSGLGELAAICTSMRSERAHLWAIWGVGEVGTPKILTIEGRASPEQIAGSPNVLTVTDRRLRRILLIR